MKRLEAVCSCLDRCRVLADIGCDHGLLSKYALDNGLAAEVVATDVSVPCLSKAQKLLAAYDNVTFRLGNGLTPLEDKKPDIIVIAGMGGRLIADILKERPEATLVLQPQSDAPRLRAFLSQADYVFLADFTAYEQDRFYDVMKLSKGKAPPLSELQLRFGVFYRQKEELKRLRLERYINKLNQFKQTPANTNSAAFAIESLKCQM